MNMLLNKSYISTGIIRDSHYTAIIRDSHYTARCQQVSTVRNELGKAALYVGGHNSFSINITFTTNTSDMRS